MVTRRLLDGLLLAALVTMTWAKLLWDTPLATLTLSNVLALAFVCIFVVARGRDWRLPRPALRLAAFAIAFLAVYLASSFDLSTTQAQTIWLRGVGAWLVHALFLIFAVAHVARRGAAFFRRCIAWFVGGLVVNAVYGLLQLLLAVGAGVNLDSLVVGPLTGGQGKVTGIQVFGVIQQASIYRVNALTGDPNHLGVELCVPLLLLLPLYLEDRRRRRLGLLLVFLLGVQALTLSRSGALGDLAGLAVLLPALRHRLPPLRVMALALGGTAAVLLAVYLSSDYVHQVVDVRLNTGGAGTARHFQFFELVPQALLPNPLFGMGFNTFAVFYEFITGDPNFGPHSFWIATLVETGIVGLALYIAYFGFLLANANAVRRSASGDEAALGLGLVAALVGTAAGNVFYLTMSFDYFFGLAFACVAAATLYAPASLRVPGGAAAAAAVPARPD